MRPSRTLLHFVSVVLLAQGLAVAKDPPAQVIIWPHPDRPILRFTFGKFKEIGSGGGQRSYTVDTTAENVWDKSIPHASFSLYLFDKNKVRIGEGWISLSNVGPKEVVKFQTTLSSTGTPVSTSLVPRALPAELASYLPAKTVSVTVNSIPQGAVLKLDGKEVGVTPKIVQVGPGHHVLQFSREGFTAGQFPLEIGPDDASGGSVSYELGTASHDTVELRDGTVLTGDVESMSATEVVVRSAGTLQHLSRNQVKRILLIEREMPSQ
jgi:hypothetical protein